MTAKPSSLSGLDKTGKKIFGLVQKIGPVTKSTLVSITNLPLTTLNRTMDTLLSNGLVIRCGIDGSSGGRKPGLYEANPNGIFCVGIDISRTYAKMIFTDLRMNILAQHHFDMDTDHTPDETIKHLFSAYKLLLAKTGRDRSFCLGIGLGTVGPLDKAKEVMLSPMNFSSKSWDRDIHIKNILETAFNLPVTTENGANTAALAEYHYGSADTKVSISYFNCGIGIRCGAVVSGSIVNGINDGEDSFGHMIVDLNGERCCCGKHGCIEAYASILSIKKRYQQSSNNDKSFIDICKFADTGNITAIKVIKEAAAVFGVGLSNYIGLINPDIIILSGPLIKASSLFYDFCLKQLLSAHSSKKTPLPLFYRLGRFGDDAIAFGAAANVLEKVLKE